MPKFEVLLARTIRENAAIVVDADDIADARAQVERVLEHDDDTYRDLVDSVTWTRVDSSPFDEEVIDVTASLPPA